MTVTSLVAAVERLVQAKIIKNGLNVLKEENICYKMLYYYLHLS